MDFQYLAIDILSDRNTYKDVREQAVKEVRFSGILRDATWKHKYLSTEKKKYVYI